MDRTIGLAKAPLKLKMDLPLRLPGRQPRGNSRYAGLDDGLKGPFKRGTISREPGKSAGRGGFPVDSEGEGDTLC